MRNKLLLAAPLLALAPAAMAQSSVTLFGVADAGISHANSSVADRTTLSSGNNATSRLGFRGVEDLGGGLRAGFWIEMGVATDTGIGTTSNINNQTSGGPSSGTCTVTTTATPAIPGTALTSTCTSTVAPNGQQGIVANRRSTVSLMGNWGEIRLGRDVMPAYWNIVAMDPFGHISIGQSVHLAATVHGSGNVWARASNSVQYLTPANLGGFYGSVGYYMGENVQTGAATEDDGSGYSLRAGWEGAGFNVGLGYARTNYAAGDTTNYSIFAAYDAKVVKIQGGVLRDRVSGAAVDGKGWMVGVTAPIGPNEIKASFSNYETNAVTNPRSNKISLGYVYNMSRRTALYAHAAHIKNNGGASQALLGSTAGANGRSTGFELGMRHSF